LRKLVGLKVFEEHGGVFDLCKTIWASGDGVVEDFGAGVCKFSQIVEVIYS
jgi:hypothetical protein